MSSLGLHSGKVEKTLVALGTVSLALWLLQFLFEGLQPYHRLTLALLVIFGGLVFAYWLLRAARWVGQKAMWRVRHRMVAVFFFVGALPLALGVLLVAVGMLLAFGSLTGYVFSAPFADLANRMRATTQALSWQLQSIPPALRGATLNRFHADAETIYPGVEFRLDLDGVQLAFPEGVLNYSVPSEILDSTTLIRKGEIPFMMVRTVVGDGMGEVVMAVPVRSELARKLVPGLGIVMLERESPSPSPTEQSVDPDQAKSGLERLREATVARRVADLPPPKNSLDWVISWPLQVPVFDVDDGQSQQVLFWLQTRPSVLWSAIFAHQSDPASRAFAIFFSVLAAAAFAFSVFVSVFIAGSLTRTLTRAVHDLQIGTTHVNQGDFSYRIPVSGSDQVSDLARSFNSMTASIERLIEDSKRRQHLEAELEIAREVQAKLFPGQRPDLEGLEVLGVCRPAESVSGDFFDYVRLDSNTLAVSFGDVSGKGISAALVMASLHAIVRTQLALLLPDEQDTFREATARVVGGANRQLVTDTAPEKYSTLFFGAYDARTATLAYSNAGHLPPLLVRNGEIVPLEVNGMVVGIFPDASYTASSLTLRSGDMLVAYTDGVTEPENEAGAEYGELRLREALQKADGLSASEVIDRVMNDVLAWTGDSALQDDMTMLVVRKA